MNIKLLLKVFAGLLFSSVVYAHPGHGHEIGALANFVHTIANNGVWLLLFVVIGAVAGYRMVK